MKSLLTFILLISTNTFAATSGTLVLQGIVPQVISVTVTPASAASSLDLTSSQTNLVVASVNESSNAKLGYKVSLSSSNSGALKRVGGTETMSYTLKYNGTAANLATTATVTTTSSGLTNVNKSIDISYTGVPSTQMVEGTYTDTLTLNITAN